MTKSVLADARKDLATNHKYISTLLEQFTFKRNKTWLPALALEAEKNILWYNVDFFRKMDTDERTYVLAFGVMLAVFDICARNTADKDSQQWQTAANYVINGMLVNEKVGKAPKKLLYNKKYLGMSTDEVYDAIGPNWSGQAMIDMGMADAVDNLFGKYDN